MPTVAALTPRLLDVEGTARYLGVSPWTVRDLLDAGVLRRVRLEFPGQRELRRVLVDRLDCDALIERAKEPVGGLP